MLLHKNAKFSGEAYNFGPHASQNFPVEDLINEMSNHWGNIKWKDTSVNSGEVHEAGLLKLNCDKALVDLNWSPNLSFEETVKLTVEWYKEYYSNENSNMHSYTISQIDQYQLVAKKRRKSWI